MGVAANVSDGLVGPGRIRDVLARAWRACRLLFGKPERSLQIPEEVSSLYALNPFGVLGLHPHQAKSKLLIRRRDELIALQAVGVAPELAVDGFVAVRLAALTQVSEKDVRRAVACLQDETECCRQALLWFCLDNEPPEVLQALAAGDLDYPERNWRERSRPGRVDGPAQHNLAVLLHARVVSRECASSTPTPGAHAKLWEESHALWQAVIKSAECRLYLHKLTAQRSDPRIGPAFAEELRQLLPGRILSVHVSLAAAALRSEMFPYAKAQLNLIRTSGLGAVAIDAALREVLAPLLDSVREALDPLLTAPDGRLTSGAIGLLMIRSQYRAARKKFARLMALDQLAPLVHSTITTVLAQLMKETNVSWRTFIEAHKECSNLIVAHIDAWKAESSRMRRVAVKGSFDGVAANIEDLRQHTNELIRAIEIELKVLNLLDELAKDSGAEDQAAVLKQTGDERPVIERVRGEYGKIKSHFDLNRAAMASHL